MTALAIDDTERSQFYVNQCDKIQQIGFLYVKLTYCCEADNEIVVAVFDSLQQSSCVAFVQMQREASQITGQ